MNRHVDGILLFDKPLGVSSNDALQQVRRLYQADKAGHTGSLDPLATGALPICLGEATKLCGVLLDADKHYVAEAQLGVRTSTGDAEGDVIETAAVPSLESLTRAAAGMLGEIEQVPPMYSALKHDGQRLYALARQGIEIERPARRVRIHALQIEPASAPDRFRAQVRCSKGTYVRTLIEDLARMAGSCAHLTALRRTAVAPFEGRALVTLSQLEAAAVQGVEALDRLLLAPAAALAHWPRVAVNDVQAQRLARGQTLALGAAVEPGRVAVIDRTGTLLGLAEVTVAGCLQPRRWLRIERSDRL
ncbi:tRNA pseudouridine(55) synthase TruB [Sinimarinibacterium sp. HSW-8]|uniref:tRNA pseudouridine synthase B n=1 Tax=Sinimarinibacterium thermocellulolyticum TaxID=3170016 RepID=A0ABV2A8X9_9GAMM